MGTLDIVLIRHGRTATNLKGLIAGTPDHPLLPEGIAEIENLVRQYPYPEVEAIYRSPRQRCLQTMQAVYPGREALVIDNLQEMAFGEHEGKFAPDIFGSYDPELFAQRDIFISFPGGESIGDCLSRAIDAFDFIVKDAMENRYQRVAVVSHAMFLDVFLYHRARPAMTPDQLFCPNGLGIGVTVDTQEWLISHLVHFNCLLPEGAPRGRLEDSPYTLAYDPE